MVPSYEGVVVKEHPVQCLYAKQFLSNVFKPKLLPLFNHNIRLWMCEVSFSPFYTQAIFWGLIFLKDNGFCHLWQVRGQVMWLWIYKFSMNCWADGKGWAMGTLASCHKLLPWSFLDLGKGDTSKAPGCWEQSESKQNFNWTN